MAGGELAVNVDVEETGEPYEREFVAVVTKDHGTKAVRGATVFFYIEGKFKGKAKTNAEGTATKKHKFDKPKGTDPDLYDIQVKVAGSHAEDDAVATIEPIEKREKKPTHWVAWIGTVIFIIAYGRFAYTSLVVTGFIVALVALVILAFVKASKDACDPGDELIELIKNNNWVFWVTFGIFLFSLTMLIFDVPAVPLLEVDPIGAAIEKGTEKLEETFSAPAVDPLGEKDPLGEDSESEGWSLRSFFLGPDSNWGMATVWNFFWMVIAYFVCYWEDWKKRREKKKEHEEESHHEHKGFWGWLSSEILFELIKGVFSGKKH